MADMENNSKNDNPAPKIQTNLILIAIGLLLITIAILLYPQARQSIEANRAQATQAAIATLNISPPTATLEKESASEIPPPPLPDPEIFTYPNQFGTLILSLKEGIDTHLFAYQPFLEEWSGTGFSGLPLTRLTSGQHQDITPDISKDGRWIAFSSDRNGYWDIYIMDLQTGDIQQFTDTQAYDGNPSWSPDGLWLVYETYQVDNLEIIIEKIDKSTGPIPLTSNPAADYAPDWSPQQRRISFISDRYGQAEVLYADLDSPEQDKAVRINNLPGNHVQHPSWSGDGRYLSWGLVTKEGNHMLVSWDSLHPEQDPELLGSGDWPLWGKDAEILYAALEQSQQTYLTAYPGYQTDLQMVMPAIQLPGRVEGLSWVEGNYYPVFTNLEISPGPTPLWEPAPEPGANPGTNPKSIIELRNLTAPTPAFIEDALGSFTSLRAAVIEETGWDFLSTLEAAFVPLNQPLSPDANLDWLYTGRGIMVNDIPRLANWLVLVREDFGYHTYWRIYLKTYRQQGSQGRPLQTKTWDLNARYAENSANYEYGGAYSESIPGGYWVDFTALAEAHGWTRFPTQFFWQLSETASRYQYFAFTQGLDLESALLELYSPVEIRNLIDFSTP
jgi:TolB protein